MDNLTDQTKPAATSKARKRSGSSWAYHIKITLDGSKPAIWRRFVVPGEIRLDKLHDVIQVVMGWTDSHLHLFEIGGRAFAEEPEEEWEGAEERGFRLCDLVSEAKTEFRYKYDFGDGWEHTLVVEKITPVPANHYVVPTCLEGKHHCPPEDVGGLDGYAQFIKAYQNPRHEEYEQYHDWAGDDYDPKAFDAHTVNLELHKLERWSRNRA